VPGTERVALTGRDTVTSMPRFRILGVAITAAFALPVAATSTGSVAAAIEPLEPILAPLAARWNSPALAAAVVRDGRILAAGAVGLRVAGGPDAVTRDDLFYLASSAKTVTATVLARLVEAGKLSWDSTLAQTFPEMEIGERFRSVRLEDLLSHRGGIEPFNSESATTRPWAERSGAPAATRRDFVAWAVRRPFHEGYVRGAAYSNGDYVVAAAMAERATGESFERLAQQWLFAPAGLSSFGFGWPATPDRPRQPRGHFRERGEIVAADLADPEPMPDWFGPAGHVHASILDFARFAALHLAALRGESRLLSRESAQRLHAYLPGSSGPWTVGGWRIDDGLHNKNGGTATFTADIVLDPAEDLGIVFAQNCGEMGREMEGTVSLLRARYGRSSPEPGAPTPGPVPVRESTPILTEDWIADCRPLGICHAATLAETTSGELVAAFFAGSHEGASDVGIWFTTRSGAGWSAPREVADGSREAGGPVAAANPVLFQPRRGPLTLFFKLGTDPTSWRGYLLSSDDGGRSWRAAQALPEGILGPTRSRPLELDDGTWLTPSSRESSARGNPWNLVFERSHGGADWSRISPPGPEAGGRIEAIQPALLRLPEGRIRALARTRNGRIAETSSADGGRSWTPVTLLGLPSPDAGIDALTLRDGRHLLAFDPQPAGRNSLALAVSRDGRDWRTVLWLERGQEGEFSYPALLQTHDGLVHVAWTWRRERIRHVVVDPTRL